MLSELRAQGMISEILVENEVLKRENESLKRENKRCCQLVNDLVAIEDDLRIKLAKCGIGLDRSFGQRLITSGVYQARLRKENPTMTLQEARDEALKLFGITLEEVKAHIKQSNDKLEELRGHIKMGNESVEALRKYNR